MDVLTNREGIITQIIGPVIDVEFEQNNLPKIYDALNIYFENGEKLCLKFNNYLEKIK